MTTSHATPTQNTSKMRLSRIHLNTINFSIASGLFFSVWKSLTFGNSGPVNHSQLHVPPKPTQAQPKRLREIKKAYKPSVLDSVVKDGKCLDPEGPAPVIFMSLGRSGTHSTWQVLGNLTGYETYPNEFPGVNAEKISERLKSLDDNWIIQKMCERQRKDYEDDDGDEDDDADDADEESSSSREKRKPKLVGFNWKRKLFFTKRT